FAFFFQAEDGIRDDLVTGVQTCALPIFRRRERDRNQRFHQHGVFEVDREIPAKVGAGGLDLVDLIFIQSHSIQSPKAERETKRQIGRASCRERVKMERGAGPWKKREDVW